MVTIQIPSIPVEARQTDSHFPQKAPDAGSETGIGSKISRQPARFIRNRLPFPVWQGMIPYEALFAYTLVIISVITLVIAIFRLEQDDGKSTYSIP